ncbi:MAG: glycosyltransferase family 2 protein, partial [Muribaculaceae bacterium]|nr:glycosyltransferase family 2 protein [Muribaculaceae bacterium]
MKVSVLVPVYGVERYIEQCAESLMQQTYKDVEYIFVNDCTPDASIERLRDVVARYPERVSQVRIIAHERNQGSAIVRQTALDAATGDAVVFVDSDDYVDTHMIECLVNEMEQSHAEMVDGGYGVVSNENLVKEFMPLHVSDKGYLKIILCQNVDSNRIWGRLIKKSLFFDNDIHFYQGIDYGEDFSVLPRLLISARRGMVDRCVYFYRNDNPQSYTNNITTRNAVSFFKAQELIGTFMASHEQWNEFSFSMQIGWVNVWRFARRFNVDRALVDEHFTQKTTHLVTRCFEKLFKCDAMPYKVVNFLYLATRRIYLTFAGR